MGEWRDRVDELLYAGESIEERVVLGDLLLTLAWALPALVAIAVLARYVVGRRRALRIEVAGGDDVVIPVDETPPIERLEAALRLSRSN